MEEDALYDNEDAGKMFRSFNLISQHFEEQEPEQPKPVFTQIPIAIFVLVGPDYIIESANDVTLSIWGKEKEVIGKPLLEVMSNFNNPLITNALRQVYTTGIPYYSNEMPISLNKNGADEPGYFHVEGQPLRNSEGKITGVVVTGFDVTSHVIARQQLQESEQKFKDMILYAPVSIAIYRTRNIIFEFTNEDYLRRVDKEASELIGKPFFEVMPEFKGQGLEEVFDEVFRTGKPYYAKAFSVNFTRNGKKDRYYSDFAYYPLRNANNEVDGVMVILNDISDLVKSTQAIAESERQFRNLVMQSPVAMGILRSRNWVVDMANDALLNIWERKYEEVHGKKLVDVFPDLVHQPFIKWMEQVYDTGEVFNEDEIVVHATTAEGKSVEKYITICFAPLHDINKNVFGIVITASDITAQVKARKQIEENEIYFRKMADTVPAIIFLWKSDGYCTYKNRQWYEYTGASGEDAQGFSWINYVDVNSRPEVQQTLFEAIKNKTHLKMEFQLRRKDGKYRWFEQAVSPRFDANRHVEGYIGTLTDIHERKLAEEQLKDAEERLRLAAEATGMATFDMDMQNFTVVHSPRLLQIFGLEEKASDSGALPRSLFSEIIHPDDLPILESAMHRAFQTGSYNYEARIIMPDQSLRWIKTEGKIFYSHSNKPMRMLGMVEDITRRKQLEQHKDDFLGIVSHELKTPVTSLKVYTQLLREQFEAVQDVSSAGMLHRMDSQINKLNLLIKDLLDTARIDTGTLQVNYQLFDLNAVLNEVSEEISMTNTTHRITKNNNQSYWVMGDAVRTSQVIFNLISNGIKYSPKAQEIVIDTRQQDRFVLCSIKDFGMGIASDNLPNVFEKYFRINNKTLGTYPGLGLGLFISAQIIRLQGGDIWAESDEGKGSIFWFSLPLASASTM